MGSGIGEAAGGIGAIKNLFGSAKEAVDPRVAEDDKSGGQKLFAGALKGGLQGFSNMQQQNGQQQGGQQQPITVQQAPSAQIQYDPNYLLRIKQAGQQMPATNGQRAAQAFYGGY